MSVETERLQQALDRASELHANALALGRRLAGMMTLKNQPELIGEAANAARAFKRLAEHLAHQLVRAQAKEVLNAE